MKSEPNRWKCPADNPTPLRCFCNRKAGAARFFGMDRRDRLSFSDLLCMSDLRKIIGETDGRTPYRQRSTQRCSGAFQLVVWTQREKIWVGRKITFEPIWLHCCCQPRAGALGCGSKLNIRWHRSGKLVQSWLTEDNLKDIYSVYSYIHDRLYISLNACFYEVFTNHASPPWESCFNSQPATRVACLRCFSKDMGGPEGWLQADHARRHVLRMDNSPWDPLNKYRWVGL